MEQRDFLKAIRACRGRLNRADLLRRLVFALSVGAGAGVLFQLLAFVTPLYYANLYSGLALSFAAAAAFAVSCIRRVTMEQAALVMDSFGFQERIVTAYEHLREEGKLYALQREDAMRQLKSHKDRIRIPLWPDWRKTALSLLLTALMVGLAFVPSQMKRQAVELHEVREEAKEKEEEIREVMDELAELESSELTTQQLQALQEMMESLESSLAEYDQVSSPEALQAAGEKLDYKYENMSGQMSQLAQAVQNGAAVSAMTAESMQAMADKLQEMSGKPSSGENQTASNQNGQNSQTGDGRGNGQGDGQGSGQGDGRGDGQGNGQGDGQGDGQGNGQGDGQGSGQGNGQGEGQGNGQGDGFGGGRGTESGSAVHDYVSVPNAIAESGNLTGNTTNHDNSEYFRAQNGLSWEGTHMSHEAVIGSYEQNAYEGIAAGRYPSGMESVIKEYFAGFN